MSNAAYYIWLSIISTIFFIITLWKKRDSKLFALYFFAAGVTYLLEYITLVLLEGYVYYPRILKEQYLDNVLGAVVSDAFTIPMIATFIAGFEVNLKKIILISSVITIIEVIFVRVNIYQHMWWTYYYTFLGAVIFYYVSRKWYSILHGRINKAVRFLTLYFSSLFIQTSTVFLLASIFKLYFYNVNWFNNPFRSHIAFATLYIMLISLVFTAIVVLHLKWYWACPGILLATLTDFILLNMKILEMSDKWSLISSMIFRIIIFILVFLFNKYLLAEKNH